MSLYMSMKFASMHSVKCFCRNDLKVAHSGQLQTVTGILLLYISLYIEKIICCLKRAYTQPFLYPFKFSQMQSLFLLNLSIDLAYYPSEFPSVFILSELAPYMCFLKFSSCMPFIPTRFPSWYVKGHQKASCTN